MRRSPALVKPRSGLVAALDVGTSKVCCLIARVDGDGRPQVVGLGHQAAVGMRLGAVVDMDGAERAVRATVEAAERMAGDNIRQVVVNVSVPAQRSRLVAFETSVAGHEIGEADLHRLHHAADLLGDLPADHELVHAIAVGYSIDGNRGIRDPLGMFGERLGVNMHVVGARSGPLRNLMTCIARCHLDVEAKVVSPYASALACLVDDEKDLGVTIIDMGAGTTSIAVFFDGQLVHTDSVAIGGVHVTNDIARGLSTPLVHAERMKTLYGSALPSPSDDHEVIKVPPIGEDDGECTPVPRSMLVGIIRPRLEETFEMVRARLEDTGFDRVAGRRVVLTGGACQIPGAPEMAATVLDKQVRRGRPRALPGLAEVAGGPAFSTGVGLLAYAFEHPAEMAFDIFRPRQEPVGRLGRIGQWFRDNF